MGFRNFGSMNYSVMYHVAKCMNVTKQLYVVTSVTKPIDVIIKCNRAITHWYKCNKANACYYECKLYKWCKLMASTIGASWCWQVEVIKKTNDIRWIFHQQGYKIGILQRLHAQETT